LFASPLLGHGRSAGIDHVLLMVIRLLDPGEAGIDQDQLSLVEGRRPAIVDGSRSQ
jgi:hypothetical protein